MAWIAALFLAVALCYSSVGFGGGSSYTAILAWQGESADTIRQVSLLCNLVVVSIGGLASWRRIDWRLMGPLLISSIPAVYFAAGWPVERAHFLLILGLALGLAGGLLLVKIPKSSSTRKLPIPGLLALGGGLGGLAGVTGIGGGIYLAPVLHLLRVGRAHEIAAIATWFILINSVVGFSVITAHEGLAPLRGYLWLPLAVAVGGFAGSRLLQGVFQELLIRRVTGVLILLVAIRLLIG